ncbi:ComEC/Rec2 family competence protein [Sphaerisporangium rubeum]|uniref:Competence protein ComEC n=1 Tax=Sphaerisporangium rubeum TaxID=321317 RepID=A0A7X0IH48_9ACTN|nr:competence protein ComEC [Sphaerisporangium rubeum]
MPGVLAAVAAVGGGVAVRVHAVTTGPVAEAARGRASVTVEVVVSDDPRVLPNHRGYSGRERVVVEGDVVWIARTPLTRGVAVKSPVVVFGEGDRWVAVRVGERVRFRGRMGEADGDVLLAGVVSARGEPVVVGQAGAVQRGAEVFREGLRKAVEVLPPEERGLLPGLVVGDVSLMREDVRQDFKDAGLSHLLAVSGANLAIIAGVVLAVGRGARVRPAGRAVVAVVAMVGFAVVARPSPSVLRALVMGSVAALALGTGRSRDGVAALSVTVLGLVLFDPALAREYGFALSVFATAGILVLAPRWRDRLARRVPRLAAEAVAVAAGAQVAVTPLLVLMSGELSLVAVPANLLAAPAVPPATVLGFAVAAVAPIDLDAARLLVHPAGYAATWLIQVARHAASLPAATIPWPAGLAGLLLLPVSVVAGWFLLRRPLSRLAACAVAAALIVCAVLVRPALAPWPPKGWLLVACDIGQGDGLVLSAGEGRAVVVDTGPVPALMDHCLRDLGVREIPLLVLTHPHADHTGGLTGALRHRPVGTILLGPGDLGRDDANLGPGTLGRDGADLGPDTPDRDGVRPAPGVLGGDGVRPVPGVLGGDGVRLGPGVVGGDGAELSTRYWGRGGEVVRDLWSRRVPVRVAVAGTVWRAGPVSLTVLGPVPEAVAAGVGEGAVVNNGSVVLHVRWPYGTALLCGDMENEAQAALLRHGLAPVDVLKIAHHGSGRQDLGFLAATRARAALISVGEPNDYGHPSPRTLARLALLGMRVYRTDRSGDLAVTAEGGRLAVVTRRR